MQIVCPLTVCRGLQVLIDIPAIGISAASPIKEVVYGRLTGIVIRSTTSTLKHSLKLCMKSVQVSLCEAIILAMLQMLCFLA